MSRGIVKTCILAGCLFFACVAATAQEVVHALTGTVSSIDAAGKTITVFTDNHSDGFFKDRTNSKAPIKLDRKIRNDATADDASKKQGAYVIVFYFGEGEARNAVGLRSLGPGPFTRSTGTVVKFEGKEHSLSIKDESGEIESFKITSDTVAETSTGVVDGFKFEPQKGDHVQVTAAAASGSATALFVNAL